MKAKMKCSNCGAEVENLKMSWGGKQFWFIIPLMLIGFLPIVKMTFFKGDVTKDLVISEERIERSGSDLEIVGLITNNGNKSWSSVTIEAEFFDSSGKFIDEANEYLTSDVSGKAKEHFKMTIDNAPPQLDANGTKMILKVSGGMTSPF